MQNTNTDEPSAYVKAKFTDLTCNATLWKRTKDSDIFSCFASDFLACQSMLLEGKAERYRNLFLSCVPLMLAGYGEDNYVMSLVSASALISVLNQPGTLQNVREYPGAEQLLAEFCARHSCYHIVNQSYRDKTAFKQLLLDLTGEPLAEDVLPNPEVVVPLLYGPAPWLLYGCAIDSPASMASAQLAVYEIWRLQPALVYTKRNNLPGNELSMLPSTFL